VSGLLHDFALVAKYLAIAIFVVCVLGWPFFVMLMVDRYRRDEREKREFARTWRGHPLRKDIRTAARAERRTAIGVRGLLGRHAWRRLLRTASSALTPLRREQAFDFAWELWCRVLDHDGWAGLSRRVPDWAHRNLFGGASGVYEAKGDRAALIAFCVQYRLAPRAPAQRAQFYALTGQAEQRRALDPDGALVAEAYWEAWVWPERQAALRAALTDSADLDVVRAIAAAGFSDGKIHANNWSEARSASTRHLTAELARHGDWAWLWRLARDMPLLDAVAAVAPIDPGWQPDTPPERELYGLLRRADPASLAIAIEAMPVVHGGLNIDGQIRLPQSSWQRADLQHVLRYRQSMSEYPELWPQPDLVDLLITCMGYRFGDDVALGTVVAGDDDIAITQPDD
jgi:hypothetical protein